MTKSSTAQTPTMSPEALCTLTARLAIDDGWEIVDEDVDAQAVAGIGACREDACFCLFPASTPQLAFEAEATEVLEATEVSMHNVANIGCDDEELAMAAALDATLAHDLIAAAAPVALAPPEAPAAICYFLASNSKVAHTSRWCGGMRNANSVRSTLERPNLPRCKVCTRADGSDNAVWLATDTRREQTSSLASYLFTTFDA